MTDLGLRIPSPQRYLFSLALMQIPFYLMQILRIMQMD